MHRRALIKAGALGSLSLVLFGLGAPAHAETIRQEGGTKDLLTGLVWSDSYSTISGSIWTWGPAQQQAAAYAVYERDASGTVVAVYDDWRVPTVAELQMAIRDGTLGQVWNPGRFVPGSRVWVWSSEARGGRAAWAVEVYLDSSGQVIASKSGKAVVLDKGSAIEVFFVRP